MMIVLPVAVYGSVAPGTPAGHATVSSRPLPFVVNVPETRDSGLLASLLTVSNLPAAKRQTRLRVFSSGDDGGYTSCFVSTYVPSSIVPPCGVGFVPLPATSAT